MTFNLKKKIVTTYFFFIDFFNNNEWLFITLHIAILNDLNCITCLSMDTHDDI